MRSIAASSPARFGARLRYMPHPKISPSTLARGTEVECLAAEYLAKHGLHLVARNFRARCGELDLVCSDATLLIIVEVRQRTTAAFGGALASVTWRKQQRILRTANMFLLRQPHWRSRRMRFDVLAVDGAPGGQPRVTWVRDAFRPR